MRGRLPPRVAGPQPPRAPRPRLRPRPVLSILPAARSLGGEGRVGLTAGPASTAFHWAWVRASPPTAFPLERACEQLAPLGPADLGTKFKDFKSTSWRLLEDRAL